jgi:hypothetical protein
MDRRGALNLGLGVWMWVLGCGSAPAAAPTRPLTPERLYPLVAGSAWSYDVDTGDGETVLATARVTEAGGGRAAVQGGEGLTRYELRPDGIFRSERDAYLLKAPLKAGASWDSGTGMRAEIARLDVAIETPAGSFKGCVEVVERGAPSGAIITTTYCPDVGPVRVASRLTMMTTGGEVSVVATLRGYRIGGDSSSGDGGSYVKPTRSSPSVQ